MLAIAMALVGRLAASQVPDPGHARPALVPRPTSLELRSGTFTLTDGVAIVAAGAVPQAREAAAFLRDALAPIRTAARARRGAPTITLRITGEGPAESYRLEVTPAAIRIDGADGDGLVWGVQTLRQLLPPEFESRQDRRRRAWSIPAVLIEDAPRFPWRGALLDVARHFLSVAEVERQVALLSRYKLNVLHWHLTDDQGWRIEIPKYPRLTEVGAWRTEDDGTRYGGYYTRAEIRRVVAFARRHHVMVVPEIDLPGHSTAAIAAYPWLGCTGDTLAVPTTWGVFDDVLCVADDRVQGFVRDLLDQVLPLFPAPYFHGGGDEVPTVRWETSAVTQARMTREGLGGERALQGWFTARLAEMLRARGRTLIGWDEIQDGGAPAGAMVQAWRGADRTRLAVRGGHDVIASPGEVYLDRPPDGLPLDRVYGFDPVPDSLTPTEAARIRGGEAAFWSERITSANLDPMMYPRLLAFAEAVWSQGPRSYPDFVSRLDRDHDARLTKLGVRVGPRDQAIITLVTRYDSATGRVWVEGRAGMPGVELRTTPPAADSGAVLVQALLEGRPLPIERRYTLEPHLAWRRPVRLATPPSSQYPGTGAWTLTDHALGSTDLHDGLWQGWQGPDLDATIDLGLVRPVREVTGSFLQDLRSWIVAPKRLTVWVSSDGIDWREIASADPGSSLAETRVERRLMTVRLDPAVPARWVRVVAESSGPLPAGHPGAGQPSWIFADEILIR